jgi:hypothetical protein
MALQAVALELVASPRGPKSPTVLTTAAVWVQVVARQAAVLVIQDLADPKLSTVLITAVVWVRVAALQAVVPVIQVWVDPKSLASKNTIHSSPL